MIHLKPKILIVIPQLHQGGVERQVAYLVEHLDRRRFEVHLAYFKNKNIFYRGLLTTADKAYLVGRGDKTSFRTFRALIRLMNQLQPDLVHLYQASANILGGFASYFHKPPVMIYSVRTTQRPWYYYTLYRMIRHRAAITLCNSQGIKNELMRRAGFPESAVQIIHNFLDSKLFHPYLTEAREQARQDLGLTDKGVVLATVGRVSYQKNQLGTIRALKLLRQEGKLPPKFCMLFVGFAERPVYAREVMAEIRELEAQGIAEIREPVQDPNRLYNAVDGIFQPSHFEGLSNVVIEAQASGSVVALSREGDNDRLITHDENGLSFSVKDIPSIADGLGRLIAVCQNDELKQKIGSTARLMVCERFSTETPIRLIEQCYESLLTESVPQAIESTELSR